jgi:hypothetical protein
MSQTTSETPKPGSLIADWIIPDRALATSLSDVHATALDVAGTSVFHGGINLNSTRAINSVEPVDSGDLVTWAYYNNKRSLLNSKGDLITHDGTAQVILPVGTTGQVLMANSATSTGLQWVTIPNHIEQDVTFSGPWAVAQTVSLFWEKFGGMCMMRIVACSGAATNLVAATAPVGSIPLLYRPVIIQQSPHVVEDNSVTVGGTITINPDGSMAIAPNSGAFGAVGNVGFYDQVLCYSLS